MPLVCVPGEISQIAFAAAAPLSSQLTDSRSGGYVYRGKQNTKANYLARHGTAAHSRRLPWEQQPTQIHTIIVPRKVDTLVRQHAA